MRAGVLVLGSLLAKYGTAKVSLPGGCSIGSRPINLHLDALKKMGANIKIKNGYIIASTKKKLKGCMIKCVTPISSNNCSFSLVVFINLCS